MLWFTSKIHGFFGPVLLQGRLEGDETGLWFGVAVLLVAIAVVGGGLLVFLIRMARDSSRAELQVGADPDELAGPDGKQPYDRDRG